MWQACETGEAHKGFWLGDLRERGHLEDGGVDYYYYYYYYLLQLGCYPVAVVILHVNKT